MYHIRSIFHSLYGNVYIHIYIYVYIYIYMYHILHIVYYKLTGRRVLRTEGGFGVWLVIVSFRSPCRVSRNSIVLFSNTKEPGAAA